MSYIFSNTMSGLSLGREASFYLGLLRDKREVRDLDQAESFLNRGI